MTPVALLAAGLAALGAGLLLSGPPGPGPRGARIGRAGRRPRAVGSPGAVVLAGLLLTGTVLVLDGVRLAVAAVVVVAGSGVAHLRSRGRRRREAERTQTAVVEVGEALVGELRAGRPVLDALARAAGPWEPFAAVAKAAALDADVPAALRRTAREPGAEGLGELAVAWDVAVRTGSGLVEVLNQVVEGNRAAHEDRRTVGTELASARATARLMVLLPVVTLGLAAGSGGAPWRLLVSEPVGVACLGAGTVLALAGLIWIDRIADGVVRR